MNEGGHRGAARPGAARRGPARRQDTARGRRWVPRASGPRDGAAALTLGRRPLRRGGRGGRRLLGPRRRGGGAAGRRGRGTPTVQTVVLLGAGAEWIWRQGRAFLRCLASRWWRSSPSTTPIHRPLPRLFIALYHAYSSPSTTPMSTCGRWATPSSGSSRSRRGGRGRAAQDAAVRGGRPRSKPPWRRGRTRSGRAAGGRRTPPADGGRRRRRPRRRRARRQRPCGAPTWPPPPRAWIIRPAGPGTCPSARGRSRAPARA